MVILEQQFEQQFPPASKRYLITRRLLEMLVCTAVLSIVCVALRFAGIVHSQNGLIISLFIGVIIFVWVNVSQCKQCFFELRDNRLYYLTNYLAYLLYIVVATGVYVLWGNGGYSWVFAIVNFLSYLPAGISSPLSAAIFHVIMLIAIFLAPLGMGWIFEEEEEEDEFFA